MSIHIAGVYNLILYIHIFSFFALLNFLMFALEWSEISLSSPGSSHGHTSYTDTHNLSIEMGVKAPNKVALRNNDNPHSMLQLRRFTPM